MFIHYSDSKNMMNKAILIGIAIAIIAILVGVYSISSNSNSIEDSTPQFENKAEDNQPKKYTQSLTEKISIKTP